MGAIAVIANKAMKVLIGRSAGDVWVTYERADSGVVLDCKEIERGACMGISCVIGAGLCGDGASQGVGIAGRH